MKIKPICEWDRNPEQFCGPYPPRYIECPCMKPCEKEVCICPPGPQGEQGLQGPPGEIGPQGPMGEWAGMYHMSALNTSAAIIQVHKTGTAISLPDEQILDGFLCDETSQLFTIPQSGHYYCSYVIKMKDPISLSTRLMVNEQCLEGSICSSLQASLDYHLSFITRLEAGDSIQLQMLGYDETISLSAIGTCASLTLLQIS